MPNFIDLIMYRLARSSSEKEQAWQGLEEKWKSLSERHGRLEGLLKMYAEYEPCWKIYSGSLELKGFARNNTVLNY